MAESMQVEIRAECPECGSERYTADGKEQNFIYRVCQGCGHRGKVMRLTQAELMVLIANGQAPGIEVRFVRA